MMPLHYMRLATQARVSRCHVIATSSRAAVANVAHIIRTWKKKGRTTKFAILMNHHDDKNGKCSGNVKEKIKAQR